MRIQRIPLFLIGLMLAVSATAQKEKDRGYWALTYKKTLLDGERFNGNNTGIENGMNGKAVVCAYFGVGVMVSALLGVFSEERKVKRFESIKHRMGYRRAA